MAERVDTHSEHVPAVASRSVAERQRDERAGVCAATEAGVGRYLIRLDTMWQRRVTVVLALPSLCARLPSSSSDLVGLSGSLALFDALDRAYVQRRASLRRSPQSRPRHLPLSLPFSRTVPYRCTSVNPQQPPPPMGGLYRIFDADEEPMEALRLSGPSSMLRSRWFSSVASWVSLSSYCSTSRVHRIFEGGFLRAYIELGAFRGT